MVGADDSEHHPLMRFCLRKHSSLTDGRNDSDIFSHTD